MKIQNTLAAALMLIGSVAAAQGGTKAPAKAPAKAAASDTTKKDSTKKADAKGAKMDKKGGKMDSKDAKKGDTTKAATKKPGL